MSKIYFRHPEHMRRFLSAMQRYGKVDQGGQLDPEYGAALYVLSSSASTWEKAAGYIERTGIDFELLFKEVDFSGAYCVLIELASNLFNGGTPVAPVELMRLDATNFALALMALQLRRNGANINDIQKGE